MHDAPGAEHIFCELYSVPDEIRATYFQLKVLELLLFLQVLDPGPVRERRPYFYRAQVEKVKAARDFMVSDLTVEHTIDELADRFDLPPTAFKTCFKGVYGLPPYAYRGLRQPLQVHRRLQGRDRPNPHRPPPRPRKVRAIAR